LTFALFSAIRFLQSCKHRAVLLCCFLPAIQNAQSQDARPLFSLSRFQSFRSNYFLAANAFAANEVKFQTSFQYQLWSSPFIYFGYSQKTFWDIWNLQNSFPLTEIDFRPEGFLEWRFTNSSVEYLRAGYEHESNGKHAPEWRAWDLIFAEVRTRPVLELVDVRVRAWYPLYTPPENRDITDYLGYSELEIRFAKPEMLEDLAIGLTLKKGTTGGLRNGSVELNLFCPLMFWSSEKSSGFMPQVHIQFWSGAGERLLNYNVPTRSFRIGLHFAV
jgi:phospholipase A1